MIVLYGIVCSGAAVVGLVWFDLMIADMDDQDRLLANLEHRYLEEIKSNV